MLTLQHCDCAGPPRELSALTRLSQLSLSWSFASHPAPNLHALSALTALEVLTMQYCRLKGLDGALDGMGMLRTLCLSGNPSLQLLPGEAWMSRLAQLDLDVEVAVASADTLSSMVGCFLLRHGMCRASSAALMPIRRSYGHIGIGCISALLQCCTPSRYVT